MSREAQEFAEAAWAEERATFGWLGKIPPEVASSSPAIVREWKLLSRDARNVAMMRGGPQKITAAKAIEARREGIIAKARQQARSRFA